MNKDWEIQEELFHEAAKKSHTGPGWFAPGQHHHHRNVSCWSVGISWHQNPLQIVLALGPGCFMIIRSFRVTMASEWVLYSLWTPHFRHFATSSSLWSVAASLSHMTAICHVFLLISAKETWEKNNLVMWVLTTTTTFDLISRPHCGCKSKD